MSVLATNRMVGFLAVALVANLVLASTLHVREAHACSCAGVASVEEEMRDSDAVFWGEAVSVEKQEPASGSAPPSLGPVTFDANEVWKGVSRGRVTVNGQGFEASCGLDFDKGKTYLVFAYHAGKGEDGPLQTNLCTSTAALSDVEAAPAALGPPGDSLPDTGGPDAPSIGEGLIAAGAAVFASLVLTGVILSRWRVRD